MNDTIITARQVADLKNILEEIRREAASPTSVSKEYDTTPTAGERLSFIERLARRAQRILP